MKPSRLLPRSLFALVAIFGGISEKLSAASSGARMVLVSASPEIAFNNDCNPSALWIDGELHVFENPYPHGGHPGGLISYRKGASIEAITGGGPLTPDRSRLIQAQPNGAYGPWFETVIADDQGVLWAYYHAEFITADFRIHPRIGAQVSRDKGATWTDLGVILDTPAGTDADFTWLGYGFVGGNGDCSALLDASGEYLYLFFSQYGTTPQTQGVGVARMRWADRAQPVGNVFKWHQGDWAQPGIGGETTPLLANIGDAHGVRAPMDFWWGPAVHWNTHLGQYVMMLNRSNSGGFTNSGDANCLTFGVDLSDPSSWAAPVPIKYPGGYRGGWYPAAIGLGAGETDKLCGREARFFVESRSLWRAYFLRPGELAPGEEPPTAPLVSTPQVTIQVGGGGSDLVVLPGTVLDVSTRATDATGNLAEHWLEVQRPDGRWSWEGWLTAAPWDGALAGNSFASNKEGAFSFTEPGRYTVRASASEHGGSEWHLSAEIKILVGGPGARPVADITVGGEANHRSIVAGTTLEIASRACDADGNLAEHWLEVQRPDGTWSWEGWLTSSPWEGALVGDGAKSEKVALFTFTEPGVYTVRSSAVDPDGEWVVSTPLYIEVFAVE